MHDPRKISAVIPQLILPVTLSGHSKSLYRSRLREYRGGLSVVLMTLEQEFGQSIGVLSHLFAVWRAVSLQGFTMPFAVVLTCCWWLELHGHKMIKHSEIIKYTGISHRQCSLMLSQAVKRGYLRRYASQRQYYFTVAGRAAVNDLFAQCFAVVLDLYDDNQ